MIHETAVVQDYSIRQYHERDNIEILQHAVVRYAEIGRNTRICSHCYIDNNVFIGNNCKIKNGVYIFDGVTIGDGCFIGPGVVFTNDPFPRADQKFGPDYPLTYVGDGASIGANATILPGVHVGERAMVGAGSVVTKDVAPYTTVIGNPARRYES